MQLFKQIYIWKKQNSDSMVRYCCFEDLQVNKFCVQSADFFSLPVNREYFHQADAQAIELFLESTPDKRCEWYDNLISAIAAHDLEFLE